jgi:hypothetical protein
MENQMEEDFKEPPIPKGHVRVYHLSDKGKDALQGTEPLTPGMILLMEIMRQCGQLTKDNCLSMAARLVLRFGSNEAATEAIKNGTATFQKEN